MLNELFNKEGRSIFDFKKGDIIVKMKPRVIKELRHNSNLGIDVEVSKRTQNMFREPDQLAGIENNLLYLRLMSGILKGKVYQVKVEEYGVDVWELFKLPEGMTLDDKL